LSLVNRRWCTWPLYHMATLWRSGESVNSATNLFRPQTQTTLREGVRARIVRFMHEKKRGFGGSWP